jgi:hypothetical protein
MKRVFTTMLVVAAVLASTATAAVADQPTLQRLNLFPTLTTPATFPADTPFFVRHGFVCLPEERPACLDPSTEFRLYVDGQQMHSRLDLELNVECVTGGTTSNDCSSRRNVTNFRFGLPAGRHEFHGEWWAQGALVLSSDKAVEFVG